MFAYDHGRHGPEAHRLSGCRRPQGLLSTSKVADAGYECHLKNKGGHRLDTHTGEGAPIGRRGSLYVMKR